MKYNTNDLSEILDVTANTIRRFEERGYLNPERDGANGYRVFDSGDLEKAIYIGRYRKIGFEHSDITNLFQENLAMGLRRFQMKMKGLDEKIAALMATRHMLNDDIILMERGIANNGEIIEKTCRSFYYVLYHKNGWINTEGKNGDAYRKFVEECPEIKYVYIFDKENIENESLVYSEGIASNEIFTGLYGVDVEPPIKYYEKRPSLMRFARLPIDMENEGQISREELKKLIYGDFLDYIKEKNLHITGDMMGVKIGFSREEDREWQYVLLNLPVERD